MFLDNLSTSVLRLCNSRKLSYEAASERCKLSSRYFGDIARGKTAPTILTLEKLCVGFELTPNELLLPPLISQEMSYRKPAPVTQSRCSRFLCGMTSGLPAMRRHDGARISAVLRPLRSVPVLAKLRRRNRYPARKMSPAGEICYTKTAGSMKL